MASKKKRHHVLPGFGFSLGYTIFYLSLLLLIPLAALTVRAFEMDWQQFWAVVTEPRVVASYRLTLGMALLAAIINTLFGLLLAWVLVRYSFPGRKLVDSLVDLPFALPTAVAGLALTALYSENGWIGRHLSAIGIEVAFTPLGVLVAMVFIGIPFLVRTVQPVLADLDDTCEEAATMLGASSWQRFRYVILPQLMPAVCTGFALAFARAVGEYGSIVFIAGNIPMVSEITPLLIITKLEQYDYAGATAIAMVMLGFSFLLLLGINSLQLWSQRFYRQEA